MCLCAGRGYGRADGQNITVSSWYFNVAIGDPAAIIVVRGLSGAWSGGEPFAIQPAVAVVDRGGNVISDQGDEHNVTVTLLNNPYMAELAGQVTVCSRI